MKKLPVVSVFADAYQAANLNRGSFWLFSLVQFLFGVTGFVALNGFSDPLFLLGLFAYYVFMVYFFRFYFKRKPYFMLNRVWVSLVPSTKIFFISLIVLILLVMLPFLPVLVGGYLNMDADTAMQISKYTEDYANFMKMSLEDSRLMDLFSFVLLVFISPVIFYRPFMAWISSIIGRSGSIRAAWNKTTHNYWRFVLVGVIMSLPPIIIGQAKFYFGLHEVAEWLIVSPMVIYFNMVIARIYEEFFLKTED